MDNLKEELDIDLDIIKSGLKRPKIPVPEIPFEKFYPKFKTVRDITNTEEWKTIYSNYYEFDENELDIDIRETLTDINEYDSKRQEEEIVKCFNSFQYFCHKYVKITHPQYGLIPFITYKYQQHVISEYDRSKFNILRKFRQGGLTTISVIWAAWRCLFKTDQKIMVMSKTDREAIAAGEVVRSAIQELPDWLKPDKRKWNDHERQFDDTNSILWFYTPEAARGKSITILIVDEAAFIPDMQRHWKAMYPVISTGGSCCVISTVNGKGNWYYETYQEAEAGTNTFNIIELDYWQHPGYNDPKWIREARANLGEKGWLQEIEKSFLGSGETYIDGYILTRLENDTKNNEPRRIKFEKWANSNLKKKNKWATGALWIWKEPQDGHEYIIGADCAQGVGEDGDNSAFQVIDVYTMEQVAEFYSCTVKPHVFAKIINEIGYYYNTAMVGIENMESGISVLNDLQHDLGYDSLYYGQKNKGEPGIKSTRINRPQIIELLQSRLTSGTIKINSSRLVNELNTFIFSSQNKRAEASRGCHDDAIMALCIALLIREEQVRSVPVGSETPQEYAQLFQNQLFEEIRKEIKEGSPESWIDMQIDGIISKDDEDLPYYLTQYRPAHALLKEFGW